MLELCAASSVPTDEAIQVIAVGPVAAEALLIEEPLDAASEANLVRVFVGANWPAHLLVPTST